MDHHQRNDDDEGRSMLTFNQPVNSVSLTSSTISILDSTSTTNSLMISKQHRIRSLRERHYQQQMKHEIESHLKTITSNILPSPTITTTTTTTGKEKHEEILPRVYKTQRQEARPLGTCVRKCGQCRQLKHVLLAECTVCFRMMDIDLKDCKCQILTNENVIDHFICSICNSELTLDGYIICANRTCQTTVSALLNEEISSETHDKILFSATLTNICYPTPAHRTVAVQVHTLINLTPLQPFLSAITDNKNEETISSSWSEHDRNRTTITLSDSSDTPHMNINSDVDATVNDIVTNMKTGFNSNQPTKLALQSEDEVPQQQSQLSTVCI